MSYSKRLFFSLITLVVTFTTALGQIGGNSVYDFIDLPASARITGAGGNLITVRDHDLSLAYHNPALLNYSMHKRITASTVAHFSGINHGYFGYAHHWDKIGTFQGGIQYISYGQFDRTDATGLEQGTFSAGEVAINVGGSRQIDKYVYGANYKLIYSNFDAASSFGMALDLAAAYDDTAKMFTATLLIKNIGAELKAFNKNDRDPIPFEIQAGFSKRLKYVPFRVSVVIHNIQRFDIRYPDDGDVGNNFLLGDSTDTGGNDSKVFDKIARHFIFSGELYLGKVIRIGFGYNHLRRQELAVDSRKGLTGFSFGVGVTVKQFEVSFARARYHLAGAPNHFTVQVNLNEFTKKKKVNPN